MYRTLSTRTPTVNATGAEAGQILRGISRNNQGLRLLLSQAQRRGCHGPITGSFVILDTGVNVHALALGDLLDRPTDAGEVLTVIRRGRSACVHVVNTNILALEPA